MKRFSFILVVLAALVFSACSDGSSDTDGKDSEPTTEQNITERNPFNATQAEIDCGLYDDSVSVDEFTECLDQEGLSVDPSSATQEELDCGLYDDSVSVDEYAACINSSGSLEDPLDATPEEIDCGLYDDSVTVNEYIECMNPGGYIEPGNGSSLQ